MSIFRGLLTVKIMIESMNQKILEVRPSLYSPAPYSIENSFMKRQNYCLHNFIELQPELTFDLYKRLHTEIAIAQSIADMKT